MTDTPARDALVDAVVEALDPYDIPLGKAWDEEDKREPGIAVAVALGDRPDLVVAALIESGWRPTDDQLRAMGGSQVVWSSTYDAWRFPRAEEPAEVDPRCTGTLGSRPEWMSPGQYDPCRCRLDAGHDGPHWCEHLDEPDPRTEEATDG